ncbi:MAG: HAD-IC family P-type ATPase [Verrucomicrobia bacterium]|nr:MAG: HAD-IC family P-type ATPase [Verrucomicrobiota bacterium]
MFEILAEGGLGQFYELSADAGRRVGTAAPAGHYGFLDTPAVRERLVDFSDGATTRVTFAIPEIHCIACVWLLENLFRLNPAIGRSHVDFPRKQVAVTFDPARVELGAVAALLDSLGYPPDLRLADLGGRRAHRVPRRLWLQLGIAGFAFGNTMLFSLPAYFGLDAASGPSFQRLVGWLSLLLALPVVSFAAGDYWRSSWQAWKQRRMSIEVPIVLGLAAIFLQSAAEVVSGAGVGYFDSMAGLLFFLLLGRVFQQKTYDRLAFDRDYRSFFPLSVLRKSGGTEERVALDQLRVGDRVVVRHGELVPADARVASGTAVVDYSFVTGESTPVELGAGAWVYAGGRQVGGAVELETAKAVSQGYLTSLWNQDVFRKTKDDTFDSTTNRYSRRFTWIILAIAVGAAAYWTWARPALAVKAFASVLIVACPCALALAAPFTLGTAQRVLGRRGIFLRNSSVIESMARVDAVVFDKTGTLTQPRRGDDAFSGPALDPVEAAAVRAVAEQSMHPLSRQVAALLAAGGELPVIMGFEESPGNGTRARAGEREVRLGSARWLRATGIGVPDGAEGAGNEVWLALDGRVRGVFRLGSAVRPGIPGMLAGLGRRCRIALLSGDQPRERESFRRLFGDGAPLQFGQGPAEKLRFVRELQESGARVMMVGDGLNDAGALRQGDVGMAVVEDVAAFSPASDVIVEASRVACLADVLEYSRRVVRVVRQGFLVSALYNAAGLAIAASGRLSPFVCAVLMPLSSATVVVFACAMAEWHARRLGLGGETPDPTAVESPATEARPS